MLGWSKAIVFVMLGQAIIATPPAELLPVPPRPASSALEKPVLLPGPVRHAAQPSRGLLGEGEQDNTPAAPVRLEPVFTSLHLGGRVVRDPFGVSSRDTWLMEARLQFSTNEADAVLPLGFSGLKLTHAELNGKTPRWTADKDELALLVAEPGRHTLILHARVPVQQVGAERRFAASLERVPRAAITSLDVVLPYVVQGASVKGAGPLELHAAEKTPEEVALQLAVGLGVGPVQARTRVAAEALGVLSQLEFGWHLPSPQGTRPLFAVTGTQDIVIRDKLVETEARLTLELREGTANRLRLKLPPLSRALTVWDDGRKTQLKATLDVKTDEATVLLLTPLTAESGPFTLLLQFTQTHKGAGDTLNLGRLELLDAFGSTQTGAVQVQTAADFQVRFLRNSGQRSATQFSYSQQPFLITAVLEPPTPIHPLLEARPSYRLQLTPAVLALTCEWNITRLARISVTEWEVRWPEGFVLDRRGLPSGVRVEEPVDGLVRVYLRDALTQASATQPFKLTLEGWLPAPGRNQAVFEPPVLVRAAGDYQGRRTRGDVLTLAGEWHFARSPFDIFLKSETTGLVTTSGRGAEIDSALRGPLSYVVEPRSMATPWRVGLGWETPRIEMTSRIEAYLAPRQLQIVQTLHIPAGARLQERLWVRLPTGVEAVSGARLRGLHADGATERPLDEFVRFEASRNVGDTVEKAVRIPAGLVGSWDLVFEWSLPVKEEALSGKWAMRFVQPEAIASVGKTELRAWAARDLRISLAEDADPWQAAPASDLAGTSVLPALEAHTDMLAPLPMEIGRMASALPDLVAERALVEVAIAQHDRAEMRASWFFLQVRTTELCFRLPAGVVLGRVRLNGMEVPAPEAASTQEGPQVRIVLEPKQLARSCVLEVEYRAPAFWRLGMVLQAPVLQGNAVIGTLRWRVELPTGQVCIYHGPSAAGEQAWRWNGVLLPPLARRQAGEMASWLATELGSMAGSTEQASLSFSSSGGLPQLWLVVVPAQAWMLGCSLLVLLVGLAGLGRRSRTGVVLLLTVLLGLAALAVYSPELLLAFAAGAQPGLLALAVVLSILWVRRRRWQRRVLLLPSFARRKMGSTLQRPASSVHGPKPASTIDAPATPDGSSPPAARAAATATASPESPSSAARSEA